MAKTQADYELMTTSITIASPLCRSVKGALRRSIAGIASPYRTDSLAAFGADGEMLWSFPAGTALDLAMASIRHHESGATEDLHALLALEARDGNDEARALLDRQAAYVQAADKA